MGRFLWRVHGWSGAAHAFVRGFPEETRLPVRALSSSWRHLVGERRPGETTWLITRAVSLKAF